MSANLSPAPVGPAISPLAAYLHLNFVPDPPAARALLSDMAQAAGAASGAAGEPPRPLLAKIVSDLTIAKGHREVALPLTGGYDSCGLLGALLDVYEPRAIKTFTFGPAHQKDCAVAARISRAVGVAHLRRDPGDVRWDTQQIAAACVAAARRLGGLPRADGIWLGLLLREEMPADAPVLVGYFGGFVTGASTAEGEGLDAAGLVQSVFRRNSAEPPEALREARAGLERAMSAIRDAAPRFRAALPGFTDYDVIDIAGRQHFRIRPAVIGPYPSGVAPCEDPRWIAHWGTRPLAERLDQRAYKAFLAAAYPAVFPDLVAGVPKTTWQDRWRERLRRWRRGPPNLQVGERGDPAAAPGLRAFLAELLSSFDARGRVAHDFSGDLARYLAQPEPRLWRRMMTVASAEIYLQAGLLA